MKNSKNPSITARFSVENDSVRSVRKWVAAAADEWHLAEAETLVLLVSELATNAVLHARTDYEVRMRVTPDDTVRVEVVDSNTRLPSMASIPADATSGRGLLIVQALASTWGVDNHGDGKLVWFELPALQR